MDEGSVAFNKLKSNNRKYYIFIMFYFNLFLIISPWTFNFYKKLSAPKWESASEPNISRKFTTIKNVA